MLTNLVKSNPQQGKVIRNLYPGPDPHQKLISSSYWMVGPRTAVWCWALPSPFNFSINFQMEIILTIAAGFSLDCLHWLWDWFFYFSCSSVMFLVLVVNFCRAHFNLTAYLNFCSGRLFVFDRKDWARPVSDSWICCSVWFRRISVSFWAYILSRILSTRITSHRIVW